MALRTIARSAFLVAVVAGAVGCTTVPRAPKEHDLAAKAFTAPPPGKANLFVFRDESLGGVAKLSVLLDSKLIGDTQGHTFIHTSVEPGPHKLVSKSENDFVLPFTAEPGKNVFVWQEVKMGVWSARSQLHLVDEAQGRQRVAACELVATPAGE